MANNSIKKNLELFGVPYQFTNAVDPRLQSISSDVGYNYMNNLLLESPIVTIIPGEPSYLPSEKSAEMKSAITSSMVTGTGWEYFKNYIKSKNGDDFRLYDFKRNYTEYMSYVNILCRAGATFLGLKTELNGTSLQHYDWRDYGKANVTQYHDILKSTTSGLSKLTSAVVASVKQGLSIGKNDMSYESVSQEELENADTIEALTNENSVKFYIDPEVSCNDSFSNSTSESQLKSAFETSQNFIKDIAFMVNSGGAEELADSIEDFAINSVEALNAGLQSIIGSSNGISSALTRLINLGGGVVKGNNIIIPEIYQSSSYSKNYDITVHLKSPYGTKLGYYINIFVPMMHIIALAVPRQASANTYGSPFLVKAYVDSIFSCNLGIVRSVTITKVGDSYSVDGLPCEVDVSLEIQDLYSDLTLSPQSSPMMFVQNTSLIEFLATQCGISITSPNIKKKYEMIFSSIENAFRDIDDDIASRVHEWIDAKVIQFTSLFG